MWNRVKPYVYSILIALGVGGLSALLTGGSMDLYKTLNQPPLAPPAWVFPVVWTILYVLMGISSALVYREGGPDSKRALLLYGIQLLVNFIWPILFFRFQWYLPSFLWLVLLWVLILWMIVAFYRVRPLATYLQIPYLVWVTFAGYLNLIIYLLNP